LVDQAAVSIVMRVRPEAVEDLHALLTVMGQDAAENAAIPLGRLSGLHFGRLLLLEEGRDLQGHVIPPALIYLADLDGSVSGHLLELVDLAPEGLDRVLGYCADYPAAGARSRATRLAYLRAHLVKADAVYINTRGRSVRQIRQEDGLREAIQQFLDRTWSDWSGAHPQVVRAAVRDYVARERTLRWALTRQQVSIAYRLREAVHLISHVLLILVLLPWALLALPFLAVLLRFHELTDVPDQARPDEEHIFELASLEDHVVQNQFSALGLVKPGPFRQFTARVVLWLANLTVRHYFNRANLAGVKTIHFARWVFLDDGRRLIFASNYDGTLENYMDDFIDKVAWGLNAVFSNGVGFPRTNWLIQDGAHDEQAFKAVLRRRQVPTQVWYSAYPHLTALNIENNARIREGLSGRMNASEAEEWLRRF
jgi:hypothetical protein